MHRDEDGWVCHGAPKRTEEAAEDEGEESDPPDSAAKAPFVSYALSIGEGAVVGKETRLIMPFFVAAAGGHNDAETVVMLGKRRKMHELKVGETKRSCDHWPRKELKRL